jgi:hypothetical protein
VLAAKPNDRVGEEAAWRTTRTSWARTLERTRQRRPDDAIQAVLAYLARGQEGAEFPFVVLSAKALDDKLDRIEIAMRRGPPRVNGHAAPPVRDRAREIWERANQLEAEERAAAARGGSS